jgi:hypothetical protein
MQVVRMLLGFASVTALVFCLSLILTAQPERCGHDSMCSLNQEAAATDPAAVHTYVAQLVQMFPAVLGGKSAYADTLTDRLARAELMARDKKRRLISEAEIVNAFNDLMQQTKAPASLKVDLVAVESARNGWEKQLPALISRQKNGSYCYPGESVFILETLIENVGTVPTSIPHSSPSVFVGAPPAPARQHLEQFSANHSQSEMTEILNHLFNALQI